MYPDVKYLVTLNTDRQPDSSTSSTSPDLSRKRHDFKIFAPGRDPSKSWAIVSSLRISLYFSLLASNRFRQLETESCYRNLDFLIHIQQCCCCRCITKVLNAQISHLNEKTKQTEQRESGTLKASLRAIVSESFLTQEEWKLSPWES